MIRDFFEQNEKMNYVESQEELEEKALKLPAGSIVYMLTNELTVYMIKSDHTAVEL